MKALQAKTERAVIEMKEKQRKWKAAKVDVRSARSKLGVVVNRYNEHAPSDGMIYDEDVEDSTSSDEEEEEVPVRQRNMRPKTAMKTTMIQCTSTTPCPPLRRMERKRRM